MRSFIYGLLLACFIPSALWSQSESGNQDFSCIKEGDNTINLYYGTNLLAATYRRLAEHVEGAEDFRVRSVGPVGLVYEHVFSDAIGLGAELGYSKTEVRFNYHSDQVYGYKFTVENLRAMARCNFHFARSDHFDAYVLLSAGLRLLRFSVATDNPYPSFSLGVSAFPLGFKPGIGLRWFITDNIGLHAEMALGTPLLCGGLSFKFGS